MATDLCCMARITIRKRSTLRKPGSCIEEEKKNTNRRVPDLNMFSARKHLRHACTVINLSMLNFIKITWALTIRISQP
ncbi:hypothetical protein D3C86_342560 [compost metagenome]